ncbi:MAG: metal-dependent hydrolase [Candidatus Caldarchaeum sp.]
MSQLKGHIAGGVVAFSLYISSLAVFFHFQPNTQVFVWFGICLLGALWPDVDTNSKSQKLFYAIFVIVDAYLILHGKFKDSALLGIFALLPTLAKHRGWTHSLSAALAIPLPLLLLPLLQPTLGVGGLEYYIPAVIGYLSHLVLDRELKFF